MLLVLAGCLVGSGSYIINYLLNLKAEKKSLDTVQEKVTVPEGNVSEEKYEFDLDIDWEGLKKINSDIVGWIYIPDTSINYPVCRTTNNEYYLNHSYDKTPIHYGAIYMDTNTNFDAGALNTFIYGHNVWHGTMFRELENYSSKDFYESHPVFYYYTPEHKYKCSIMSFYMDTFDADTYRYDYVNHEHFEEYLKEIKQKSKYETQQGIDGVERIISLYTCSYENENPLTTDVITDRYYVHAAVIEVK